MILGITGHSPVKLGGWVWNPAHRRVQEYIRRCFRHLRPEYVITGMALGVEQWGAEIAIEMGIPFLAAIPFDGFEGKWPAPSQMKYRNTLSKSFRTQVVSPGGYESWKLAEKNKWVVENSDQILSIWDGDLDPNSGVSHATNYALRIQKPVLRVHPNEPLVLEGEQFEAPPTITPATTVSQTAREIIERTRALRPASPPAQRTQILGAAPRTNPDAPANPYKRVLDID